MLKQVISYNINGVRAAVNKGFHKWVKEINADILCIQETKIQSDQVNKQIYDGYGYNTYWHSAEKKGYSGTALLTKDKPDSLQYGTGITKFEINTITSNVIPVFFLSDRIKNALLCGIF